MNAYEAYQIFHELGLLSSIYSFDMSWIGSPQAFLLSLTSIADARSLMLALKVSATGSFNPEYSRHAMTSIFKVPSSLLLKGSWWALVLAYSIYLQLPSFFGSYRVLTVMSIHWNCSWHASSQPEIDTSYGVSYIEKSSLSSNHASDLFGQLKSHPCNLRNLNCTLLCMRSLITLKLRSNLSYAQYSRRSLHSLSCKPVPRFYGFSVTFSYI